MEGRLSKDASEGCVPFNHTHVLSGSRIQENDFKGWMLMSDFIDTLDRTVENSFELEVWDGSRLVSRTISHNGRVQAGGIAVHAAIFGGTGISFKYFALSSASGLSPANGDTTLASEIDRKSGV